MPLDPNAPKISGTVVSLKEGLRFVPDDDNGRLLRLTRIPLEGKASPEGREIDLTPYVGEKIRINFQKRDSQWIWRVRNLENATRFYKPVGVDPTDPQIAQTYQDPVTAVGAVALEAGFRFLDPPPPPIPPVFSWRSAVLAHTSEAYDQGTWNRGSEACAAFAVLSAVDFVNQSRLRAGDLPSWVEPLSAAHLTDITCRRFGRCSTGRPSVGECFLVAKEVGIVRDTEWPFDPTKGYCWTSPPDVSAAQHYRFNALSTLYIQLPVPFIINPVAAIKNGLAYGLPVVDLGIISHVAGWENDPEDDPLIHVPNGDVPPDDFHVIAITGCDDNNRIFQFKNSWGRTWGKHGGYGKITYEYIAKYTRLAMVASDVRHWPGI